MTTFCPVCRTPVVGEDAGPHGPPNSARPAFSLCDAHRRDVEREISALESQLAMQDHAEGRCLHGRLPSEFCTPCEAES